MPNARRAHSNTFHLRSRVDMRETSDGFELVLDVRGTDQVPVTLEMPLRGRRTHRRWTHSRPRAAQRLFPQRRVWGSYEFGGHRLRTGPGFRRHAWTQLRGAEPRLEGVSLYLTDFTPLARTLLFAAV
jgi:hypothetical protein